MLTRYLLSALSLGLLTPVMPVARAAEPAPDTDKRPLAALAATVQERVRRERAVRAGAGTVTVLQTADPKNIAEALAVVVHSPTVICPMLIVPVDPSIDPQFVAPTPKGTKFTMRSVAPPVCR